jgi:malic enzyme
MGIPVGKLALYSAAAGIHPGMTLPVSLDVGTDRASLLADPLYVGWRHPRLRGAEYDAVVEAFVAGVERLFPNAVIQWEDFKQHNALRLLDRYRERTPSFNDDIQGTSAVAMAGILAGLRRTGRPLGEQRFVMAGGGAAGIGISRLIVSAFRAAGLSQAEAHRAIAVVDSHGLVYEGRPDLDADKLPVAMTAAERRAAGLKGDGPFDLEAVVRAVHPTVLIGTTGQAGAFTESMIRAMAEGTPQPIIFPLSNPTANTEAVPADILAWTEGRALVATGSPFDPVTTPDGTHVIGQANNVHVFPGIGLGAIVSETRVIPDVAFLRAAETLAAQVSESTLASGSLYPPISALRANSRLIAIAVVRALRDAGVGRAYTDEEIPAVVDAAIWSPVYLPYRAV